MLLPIRRPVRPEPLPLRERLNSDQAVRPPQIWVSVRTKRHRPPASARFLSNLRHGRAAAARG